MKSIEKQAPIAQRHFFAGKLIFLIAIFLVPFVLTGCRVDLEVWVDNFGGGKGIMAVTGAPISEAELRQKLIQKGIDVVSVSPKDLGLEANIKWTDFNKSFGSRIENQDGSIVLDFGHVELGTITVHVDGKIDQGQTRGNFKDLNTVIFNTGSMAKLVYMPNKRLNVPLAAIVIIIILTAVGIIVFLKRRSSESLKQSITQTEQTSSKDIVSKEKASDKKFCRNCGTQFEPADDFCTNCGKQKDN